MDCGHHRPCQLAWLAASCGVRKPGLMKVRGKFFNDLNIENHQALITVRREPDLVLFELTLRSFC